MNKLPPWAPRVAGAVLVMVLVATAKAVYDHGVEERTLAATREHALQARVDSLLRRKDSTTVLYRRDTVRLTTVVNRWRQWVDTLHLTTTDTLTVRESVIVAKADSAINQCVITARTCADLQAQKDSIIDAQRALIDNVRSQRPGFFRRTGDKLKWIVAGVAVGAVVVR